MKFEIKNRWNGELIFSIETDTWKLAVEAAIKAKANLRSADLRSANLSSADLSSADLSYANLSYANLRSADLSSADLRSANLSSADLSSADLSYANLSYANLRSANLSSANLSSADLSSADLSSGQMIQFRDDIWAVLCSSPLEVSGLRQALVDGKVDGSTYTGACACLVGTIANVAHVNYQSLPVLKPNPGRPAEVFFTLIKEGDTPKKSKWSKQAIEWIDEWTESMTAAFQK